MSSSHAKRKVMGRIDLSNVSEASPSHSPRAHAHTSIASSPTPPPGSNHVRKAKVNLSSIVPAAGAGVSTNTVSASQGARAHISSASTSSPPVRSPLNGLANHAAFSTSSPSGSSSNYASPSPSLHTGPVRAANADHGDSRAGARSPSPSRSIAGSLSPSNVSGKSSHSLTQQRPKARPVSAIYGQEVVWSSSSPRATPTSLSAKVTTAMNDIKPVRAHLRTQSSFPSGSGASLAKGLVSPAMSTQSRSRSPSPTMVKAQQQSLRRISHGSSTSLGGSSAASSPINTTVRPQVIGRTSNGNTARPAMSSTSYFPGVPMVSSHPTSSVGGLESPVHLLSATGGTGETSNQLISPTGNTATVASPNVLLSPAVELDAEAIEAKTNRKILDLEITNRSLLAINSGLEMVKLQQAREIRELKRHVREGRALSNRLDMTTESMTDLDDGSEFDDNGDDDDASVGSEIELPLNTELEQAHQRCNILIDQMVVQAREAILSKHDTERRTYGNRVLHPAEVDAMRQAEEHGPTVDAIEVGADDQAGRAASKGSSTPQEITVAEQVDS